jgi:hypothetical protein
LLGNQGRRDAIEAHLTAVFAALAVAREAQDRVGLAIRNVIRQFRPLRSADRGQRRGPGLPAQHRP